MGVTVPIVGLIIGLAGAATGVAGTVISAKERKKQARRQAEAAAAASLAEAKIRREEADRTARQMRLDAKQQLARQRLSVATSGVAFEGSTLDLLNSNAAALEEEALAVQVHGADAAALLSARAQKQRAAGDISTVGQTIAGLGSAAQSVVSSFQAFEAAR